MGEVIWTLMSLRGLTGAQLGEDICFSATSISRIIQGYSQHKQVTFPLPMKRLYENTEAEQLVLQALRATV